MKNMRIAALVAAALVVGVIGGNVVSAVAAPVESSNAATAAHLGLRLGSFVQDAGGRLSDIVAKLTGLSTDAVIEQRQAGTSYAEIATSKGVSVDAVTDAAVDVREKVLDERVASGAITQDAADAALVRMTDRVADRVADTDATACDGTDAGAGRGAGTGPADGTGRGAGRGRGMGNNR
jgi:hypothetical protein